MARLTAVLMACAALLNASAAMAQRGPPFGITSGDTAMQTAPSATPRRATFSGSVWTDPSQSFSFNKPRSWKDVDTASVPGAERLEIVAGDEKSQCWFTRIPRASTKTMQPKQLIEARSAPISPELWSRIAINQQLLVGVVQVLDHSVEVRDAWPIQVARLRGRNGEVYTAIHSRPGVDITAFCAARDDEDRAEFLNEVARSVTTPHDAQWQAQIY